MAEPDTKTLILDAAERLFADLGFEAASLRHIIKEAGVNLAAVHYHFGSKEALIEAVLVRRLEPLNQERLRLLDGLEAAGGGRPAAIEDILTALVGPALRLTRDSSPGAASFMRLAGRLFTVPNPQVQAMVLARFNTVFTRFTAALHRSLPALPPPDFFWRVHFLIGAMGHTMCNSDAAQLISAGVCDARDTEGMIGRLVDFLAGGLKAPVRTAAPKKKGAGDLKRRHKSTAAGKEPARRS